MLQSHGEHTLIADTGDLIKHEDHEKLRLCGEVLVTAFQDMSYAVKCKNMADPSVVHFYEMMDDGVDFLKHEFDKADGLEALKTLNPLRMGGMFSAFGCLGTFSGWAVPRSLMKSDAVASFRVTA